jgi:predicted ATPase/DNA-binding winged helix-turn-helix (wHTH) protein
LHDIVVDMVAGSVLPASVEFGRFRVLLRRRELLADGRPTKLGGRAFDILVALIEAREAFVSKDALMERVWPGRIVEENNLQAHISVLRAALGPDRDVIRTVFGRGYQFIGEIRASPEIGDERAIRGPEEAESGALAPTNVPEPVSELIGRDDELAEVINLMGAHRLVTLTGVGGIGKTRLAAALARELRPHFEDGVWLAQFSPLADPKLVPAAITAAVGLELGGEASVQNVAQGLAGRRLLLVLDTCEHVIEIAASMTEAALGAGSELRILATSRESLKAEGEWVYPVSPLAVPRADVEQGDFLEYGAIRLFMERARAADPRFAPDRPRVELIAAICRRLDGIPLAIELAAARAPALGVEGLAAGLNDRFHLLTGGKRTAPLRHQTLRAALDWSYALLDEHERILLRRLAVFAGTFALDAVRVVVTGPELSALTAVDGITRLIAKSLVATEGDGGRYRLLDTTRAYAAAELDENGEREPLARRHAEYYRDVFERAEFECQSRPTAEWLADYSWRIDNVRAALDWAFSPGGDSSIGVALTTAAAPLWMHLLLLGECRTRTEQALVAASGGAIQDGRSEMKLHAALSHVLTYTGGSALPEIATSSQKALDIAERLGDIEYQLRSIWSLWAFNINAGSYRSALDLAQRFSALAPRAGNERLTGKRMIGIAHHFLGDQSSARPHLEEVLADYVAAEDRSLMLRFQLDLVPATWVFLARVLWVQGFPERAKDAADHGVELAQSSDHANTLGLSLVRAACPIAVWMDNLEAADHYVELLLDRKWSDAFGVWQNWYNWGRFYQGLLSLRRGDVVTGLRMLRSGFEEISDHVDLGYSMLRGIFAEAVGYAGQIAEGLVAIEEGIVRAEHNEEGWIIAELLRIKGELLLLKGGFDAAAAVEQLFRQACDEASRQEALAWELRAATSLARLLRDQSRSSEAIPCLQRVYDRFTEGFDTADLKAAKALLDELA